MVKQFFNINLKIVDEKASDWQNCAICIESVANTIVKIIKCNQCSHMIHDVYFRKFTHTSRNSGKELSCPNCRLSWKSYRKYFIEGVKQDDSQVEDVDVIFDDSNPGIIDVDPNCDIVDDDQLCFSTESLNPFHYNMYKTNYGQDGNKMIDIIILRENDLN